MILTGHGSYSAFLATGQFHVIDGYITDVARSSNTFYHHLINSISQKNYYTISIFFFIIMIIFVHFIISIISFIHIIIIHIIIDR